MIYCIDTSCLVESWNRLYPPDRFPSFWEKLDDVIDEDRVLSPDEVYRELQRKDDELHKWAKKRKALFSPLEGSLLSRGIEITNAYPRLLEQKPGRNGADPWVIALAADRSAAVVTEEKPSGNMNKPKIPDVCKAVQVKCINVLDLIRQEDWQF